MAILACAGLLLGAGQADAARVPTVAVTTSGQNDWQITFDRGAAKESTPCHVWVKGKKATPPEGVRTMLLKGSAVRPGIHPVHVRCGKLASPTVHLFAPRQQLNDLGTWLSNSTAGIIGY